MNKQKPQTHKHGEQTGGRQGGVWGNGQNRGRG